MYWPAVEVAVVVALQGRARGAQQPASAQHGMHDAACSAGFVVAIVVVAWTAYRVRNGGCSELVFSWLVRC